MPLVSHSSMGVEVDLPYIGFVPSLSSFVSDAHVITVRPLSAVVLLEDISVLRCREPLYSIPLNVVAINSVDSAEPQLIHGEKAGVESGMGFYGEKSIPLCTLIDTEEVGRNLQLVSREDEVDLVQLGTLSPLPATSGLSSNWVIQKVK